MSYVLTHYFDGGTEEEYRAVLAAVHPDGQLPVGQTYHGAGSTGDGFMVQTVWDSKDAADRFISEVLLPKMPTVEGGFTVPPQEHAAITVNEVRA